MTRKKSLLTPFWVSQMGGWGCSISLMFADSEIQHLGLFVASAIFFAASLIIWQLDGDDD